MPELPEVETIARTLEPGVAGRAVLRVELPNPRSWEGPLSPADVLAGGPPRIAGVGRRGKLLLLRFAPLAGSEPALPEPATPGPAWAEWPEGPDAALSATPDAILGLAFHLRMTGRLQVRPRGEARPGAHTRLILHLDDGCALFFDDTRKFGRVRAISPATLAAWPFWQHLGPEPLLVGEADFIRAFQSRAGSIKALLLDQRVLAGVGNIYADESLFRAGLHPAAPARGLGPGRLALLRRCLVDVLEESIAACGSSIRDYRDANGDAGAFQNDFRVYGRAGQACRNCGAPLAKAKIAGRSTVFCPVCQQA